MQPRRPCEEVPAVLWGPENAHLKWMRDSLHTHASPCVYVECMSGSSAHEEKTAIKVTFRTCHGMLTGWKHGSTARPARSSHGKAFTTKGFPPERGSLAQW